MKQLQDLFKFSITTILLCLLISKSVYASEIKVMIDDKTEKAMYQEEIEGECPDADILPDTATNSGKCGDDLTWNYDGKETLTISGSGNMYDWDSADTVPWYSFRYSIKKISLPENLTGIGSYAFTECYIKSIDFPKDLKKLGEAAFWSCHELEQVILPDGLTEIGTQNFSDCYKLKKAVIPASVTTIASNTGGMLCNVFHSMNLKSVGPTGSGCSIEYGWTEKIPDRAFYGSSYITEIKLPAGLKKIGDEAFNAASVTEIIIPDGVESIGHSAFGVYGDLKHIVVPASVTKFGYNGGFAGSSIKTAGPIGGGYDYEFGWETEIPAGAFDQCYNLEYIRIPETITANNASYTNKAKLKTAGPIGGGYNVEFGWKKEIPKYGLSSFNSLESLVLPDSIEVIGDNAISSDYVLKSVKMPSSLKTIGDRAFYYCNSLENITIPSGSIGSYAFEKCDKLSAVVMGDGVDTIGTRAFNACAKLTTLELGNNVKSIGESAFYSCTSLTEVILPENLEIIDENAFNNCRELKTLQMGNKVTYIGYNAFRYCSALEKMNMSKSLEYLGACAFSGCASIVNVEIGKNVSQIYYETFKDCISLESVIIHKCIGEIDQDVFSGCTGITDIYYGGTRSEWKEISVDSGNEVIQNARMHYDYDERLRIIGFEDFELDYDEYLDGKGDDVWEYYVIRTTKKNLSLVPKVTNEASYEMFSDKECTQKIDPSCVTLAKGENFYFIKISRLDENVVRTIYVLLDAKTNIGNEITEKTIVYSTGDSTKNVSVKWGGNLFTNSSTDAEKNKDIALLAAGLSAMVEGKQQHFLDTGDLSMNRDDMLRIQDNLHGLGFEYENIAVGNYKYETSNDIKIKNMGSDSDSPDGSYAYVIASESIKVGGRVSNILMVIARGSATGSEFRGDAVSNTAFHPNEFGGYKIYDNAYTFQDSLIRGLNTYLIDHKFTLSEGSECTLKEYQNNPHKDEKLNLKVLITGHSLGGAAANLLGERMTRGTRTGGEEWWCKLITQKDIFVYTFGGINCIGEAYVNNEPVMNGYENIRNIYNFYDSFGPKGDGSFFHPTSVATNRPGYKIGSVHGKFGYLDMFEKEYDTMNHNMPNYVDAVENGLIDYNYEYDSSIWKFEQIYFCPVNIEVYRQGKLVGRISDNIVDKSVTEIPMYVVDDEKHILLKGSDEYEVRIRGNDDGTMDTYIQNICEDRDPKLIRDVSIEKNKEFSISSGKDIDINDIKMFVLDDAGEPTKEVQENGTEIRYNKYGEVLSRDVPSDGNIPDGIWVAGVEDLEYDGTKQVQDFRVYDGTKLLTLKTDYTASYKNNQKVYTIQDPNNLTTADKKSAPQIILTMKGNYSGKETVYFSINLAPDEPATGNEIQMSKVSVTAIPSQVYIGAKYTVSDLKTADGRNPLDFAVSYSGSKLSEGVDYKVAKILDAANPGTATLVLKGLNAKGTEGANTNSFIGEKRIKFKINAYPMTGDKISITDRSGNTELSAVFNKSGAKPEIRVMFDDLILKEGRDYTLKYSGNTKYPATKASITITGKGSFKDKVVKSFAITPRSFSEGAGITVVVADKAEAKKAGQFQTTVKVYDSEGKLLKSGMDYEKDIVYLRGDTELKKTDHPKAGEVLTVRVIGKGGYSNTAVDAHYKILPAGSVNDIGKAIIKIKNQDYNRGEAITISSQVQLEQAFIGKEKTTICLSTDGGVTGDFMVVPGSYVKNIDKGTAKVTFMGINGYSGTKTVSFKIGTRSLKDIWRGWVRK